MRVKPAPGLKFRDPYTKHPYDENDEIEVADTDLLYAKFLEQGDVVLVTQPASEIRASAGSVENKQPTRSAKP
jgi:hypothetical protein